MQRVVVALAVLFSEFVHGKVAVFESIGCGVRCRRSVWL